MKTLYGNRLRTGVGLPPRSRPPFQPHRPEVESFYHLSGTELSGRACQGTACFVARHLHPKHWADATSREPRVYCLGQCFAAPAMSNGHARPHVEVRSRHGIVLGRLENGGARGLSTYTANGGYRALEQALGKPREDILKAIEISGLRGRGGAGFPTGRKWRAVAQRPPGAKFIVANADEGDAGAYIDRFLMEDDPFALIEGMTAAAYAVGASQGWIYLRAEYPDAEAVLREAIAEARRAGLLGEHIRGHDFKFDIEILVGHGSYICGEETALIRSIEGRRPEVQTRPPMPTERGLFGEPTLVNNVETLVNVPWILQHGGEAYRALGFSQSRGTKAVSLNSLFQRPGLYEVEFGVSVRHIVEELGGGLRAGSLKGVIIGGPLAGIIPPHLLDTPFGFEELRAIGASVGHGGVMAFDGRTSIPELVHHIFSFGAYESCGKCTPCRLGSRRAQEIFQDLIAPAHEPPPHPPFRLRQAYGGQVGHPLPLGGGEEGWAEGGVRRFKSAMRGQSSEDSLPEGEGRGEGELVVRTAKEFTDIVSALKWTSLCGHGIGLGEFAESVLRHYRKELEPCFK